MNSPPSPSLCRNRCRNSIARFVISRSQDRSSRSDLSSHGEGIYHLWGGKRSVISRWQDSSSGGNISSVAITHAPVADLVIERNLAALVQCFSVRDEVMSNISTPTSEMTSLSPFRTLISSPGNTSAASKPSVDLASLRLLVDNMANCAVRMQDISRMRVKRGKQQSAVLWRISTRLDGGHVHILVDRDVGCRVSRSERG